jgi:hypothetical protein
MSEHRTRSYPTYPTPAHQNGVTDTVTQLLSTPVTQCLSNSELPEGGKILREIPIESTCPKNRIEAENIATMAGGPLWRLAGAVLAHEQQCELSEDTEDNTLKQFYEHYVAFCRSGVIDILPFVEIEDAYFRNKGDKKVPEGIHPASWAFDLAKQRPLPPEAERYKDDLPERAYFIAALRNLATLDSDAKGQFFLSCRDAAQHMELRDRTKASLWLRDLACGRRPILKVQEKGKLTGGGRGEASQYIYLPLTSAWYDTP